MNQTHGGVAYKFLRLEEPTSFPQLEQNSVYTGNINWQVLTAIEDIVRSNYR